MMDPTVHTHFDDRALRRAFGRFATGVAVATTAKPGARPVGLTVNSFTSLSLDPPLLLWCLRRSSASLPAFTAADHFAINVLAAHQRPIARRFAAPAPDRFADLPWYLDSRGLPGLHETIARFVCRTLHTVHGGDHLIVIGVIEEYDTTPGIPLVFLDGQYRELS